MSNLVSTSMSSIGSSQIIYDYNQSNNNCSNNEVQPNAQQNLQESQPAPSCSSDELFTCQKYNYWKKELNILLYQTGGTVKVIESNKNIQDLEPKEAKEKQNQTSIGNNNLEKTINKVLENAKKYFRELELGIKNSEKEIIEIETHLKNIETCYSKITKAIEERTAYLKQAVDKENNKIDDKMISVLPGGPTLDSLNQLMLRTDLLKEEILTIKMVIEKIQLSESSIYRPINQIIHYTEIKSQDLNKQMQESYQVRWTKLSADLAADIAKIEQVCTQTIAALREQNQSNQITINLLHSEVPQAIQATQKQEIGIQHIAALTARLATIKYRQANEIISSFTPLTTKSTDQPAIQDTIPHSSNVVEQLDTLRRKFIELKERMVVDNRSVWGSSTIDKIKISANRLSDHFSRHFIQELHQKDQPLFDELNKQLETCRKQGQERIKLLEQQKENYARQLYSLRVIEQTMQRNWNFIQAATKPTSISNKPTPDSNSWSSSLSAYIPFNWVS